MRWGFVALWAVALCGNAVGACAQAVPLVLTGGTVVNDHGTLLRDAVVVMRGDTIVAVGSNGAVAIPAGSEVIDVTGLTLVPGLIDGHVHLGIGPFVGNATPIPAHFAAALDRGVTTVVDLGSANEWILALRDSVARGLLEGPRILAAGAVVTAPGGHPAGTWLRGSAEAAALGTRQVGDAAAAAAAVERLVADGVDVIKLIYDGGSQRSPFGLVQRLDAAALVAGVAAARTGHRPVHVHWQQSADLADVAAARPDVLVHLPVGPLQPAAVERCHRPVPSCSRPPSRSPAPSHPMSSIGSTWATSGRSTRRVFA